MSFGLLTRAVEAGSSAFRAVLQDLAGALHAEGALSGLAWVDARLSAAAVSFDACTAANPVESLRRRAAAVNARPRKWLRRLPSVAQALDTVGTVLELT